MRLTTLFLFLGMSILTPKAYTQITITTATLPIANTFVVERFLDSNSAKRLNIGSAGANQTWNFANVNILSAINNDTTHYIAASRTPCARQFAGAQLAVGNPLEYNYYMTNSNGIFIVGSCSPTDSTRAIPPQVFMRTPFRMGDSYNDTSKFITYTPNSNDTIVFRQNLRADAWGTITTPAGTFNALRVIRNIAFSVEIPIQGTLIPITTLTESIEWWSDTRPAPVFSRFRNIIYTPGGNDTSAYEASFMQRFTVGTNEPINTLNNIEKVYPNPAFQQISIAFELTQPDEVRFEVINLTGQMLFSTGFEAWTVGKNTKNIDLENISSGIYVLKMVNRANQIIGIQKFSILK